VADTVGWEVTGEFGVADATIDGDAATTAGLETPGGVVDVEPPHAIVQISTDTKKAQFVPSKASLWTARRRGRR
jgi:hypothetical protein